MNKELFNSYAESTHKKIIGWTANCDTKATVIFAFVGILIPLLFTNSYINGTITQLITPIELALKTGEGNFCLLSLLMIITFITTIVFLTIAVCYLLNSLTGNNNKNDRNKDSILFFASIASLSDEDWHRRVENADNKAYQEDLINQIHICSQICTKKFKAYNNAVFCVKCAIPLILSFLVLSLFL